MSTEVWRAASADNPYLGFGSYWTNSRSFAQRFSLWAKEQGHDTDCLYRTTVGPDDPVLDPRHRLVPSSVVNDLRDDFADLGYRWIVFYEGVFDGVISPQWGLSRTAPTRGELRR